MTPLEPDYSALRPAIHPAYPRLVIAELARQGLTAADVLEGNTLSWEQLMKEKRFISLEQFRRMIHRAMALTGKPWLALELKGVVQVSAHGPLGFGALSASSVAEALALIQRLIEARFRVLGFDLTLHGPTCRVVVQEKLPTPDLREFFLCIGARALMALMEAVAGRPVPQVTLSLNYPEPSWSAHYQSAFGDDVRIRWSAVQPTFEFPTEVLRWRSLTADADAFRQAQRDCELLLGGRHVVGQWPERIRDWLYRTGAPYPTLADTAQHFHVSPRTLIRRLRDDGVRYQSLLDEVRQELALWYLHHTALPVALVAEKLGFEDTTNFARTCRRWFGRTAGEIRTK